VHFHAAGQAIAGKGELELRELLARPDPDGGEVPDIVVGSYIGPLSPLRESPALLRRDSLYPGPISAVEHNDRAAENFDKVGSKKHGQ
jgi:hypothetical protein